MAGGVERARGQPRAAGLDAAQHPEVIADTRNPIPHPNTRCAASWASPLAALITNNPAEPTPMPIAPVAIAIRRQATGEQVASQHPAGRRERESVEQGAGSREVRTEDGDQLVEMRWCLQGQ